ncbi:insect cuticle protein domain-containing protein [Phthorimaea operculella]|nr:insect cuticle protein domain-containing protein [Phthorimaea operculella]
MKSLIATACLVALALAEPPPSNRLWSGYELFKRISRNNFFVQAVWSYLPPPSSRSGGYPQGGPQGGPSFGGGPQVIAARALDHGGHGAAANGFARSNAGHHGGASARFGGLDHDHHGHGDHDQKGYDQNASPFGRNGLDDASGEPASYNFGYMVNDFQEGTDFGHHEERQDERAEGEYHVVLPDGRKQTVSYEADEGGFKPHISYEDSDALARSNGGYDDNANNVHGSHGNGGFGNGGHGNHGNARSNGY